VRLLHLTNKETEIMWVFWKSEKALSPADIYKIIYGGSRTRSAIYIILNSLLEKGFIADVGFIKSGKTFSKTYLPTISCSEYLAPILREIRPYIDITKFVSSFIHSANIDSEFLDELEVRLNQLKSTID
jgi:predicted transcriptional regulator